MNKRKVRLKLKKNVIKMLKVIGVFFFIFFIGYFIYAKQINNFVKLGYSKAASKEILFSGNKSFVLSVGENATLNAAFESEYYKKEYLENYSLIEYQKQDNLIKNINSLLGKGYSNKDISIILSHGDDAEVSRFSKRKRIKYLEEFYQYPYAKLDNYDRYVAYSDETGEDEKITVIHVNLNMDKEEYVDIERIDKFGFDMLVNKYHSVDSNFVPDNLVDISKVYTGGEKYQANGTAVAALVKMFDDAKRDGLEMEINSAYRSYNEQIEIAEFYRKWYGDNYVNNYVAKPGHSEHQTGLAFDIGSATVESFSSSKEYTWMQENAHKYGFIRRFYKNAESLTGFRSEPWHYRYVGKEIASYIFEHNITFEEYYVMFLDN